MLVAPSEPKPFLVLGDSSSIPERYGVDFLFGSEGQGLVGVQRKTITDFIASIRDNRLQREVPLMLDGRLDRPILILEGVSQWTNTGQLLHSRITWTMSQHLGLILSLNFRGIWVVSTSTMAESIDTLSLLTKWCEKTEHKGLDTRPKMNRDPVFGTKVERNGKDRPRHQALNLLQGIDGVSITRARAIYDHFGEAPLRFMCTADEMAEVPGIGIVTAKKIVDVFGDIYQEAGDDIDMEASPMHQVAPD